MPQGRRSKKPMARQQAGRRHVRSDLQVFMKGRLFNNIGLHAIKLIYRYESPGEDSRDHFPPEAGMTAPNST